jgi:Fe-S-cluster containining protein
VVYLTPQESLRLNKISGIPATEFTTGRQDASTGLRFSTLNQPCRFLNSETGDCTVYESRPLACRIFPFYLNPFTGAATLCATQCNENMMFPPNDSGRGWRLIDFERDVNDWMVEFWE